MLLLRFSSRNFVAIGGDLEILSGGIIAKVKHRGELAFGVEDFVVGRALASSQYWWLLGRSQPALVLLGLHLGPEGLLPHEVAEEVRVLNSDKTSVSLGHSEHDRVGARGDTASAVLSFCQESLVDLDDFAFPAQLALHGPVLLDDGVHHLADVPLVGPNGSFGKARKKNRCFERDVQNEAIVHENEA